MFIRSRLQWARCEHPLRNFSCVGGQMACCSEGGDRRRMPAVVMDQNHGSPTALESTLHAQALLTLQVLGI